MPQYNYNLYIILSISSDAHTYIENRTRHRSVSPYQEKRKTR